MRLPEVLRKLFSALRRLLGLESAGAPDTPALSAGRSAEGATPALAEGATVTPAEETRAAPVTTSATSDSSDSSDSSDTSATPATPANPATAAKVSAGEPSVEGEGEAKVSAGERPVSAVGQKAVDGDERAELLPGSTPASTPAQGEPAPEQAKVLGDRQRSAKAREPRRTRRAAAYSQLEPALAVIPVRRFFSRLTAQESGHLSKLSWPQVRVESFFLALTQPRVDVIRGRGPAVVEPQVLDEAFADFVWD